MIPSDTAVARPKPKPVKMDDSALNSLVDMGFQENRARKALHATRYHIDKLFITGLCWDYTSSA